MCDVLYTGQCIRTQDVTLERKNIVNKFNLKILLYSESFTLLLLQGSFVWTIYYDTGWYTRCKLTYLLASHMEVFISMTIMTGPWQMTTLSEIPLCSSTVKVI